MVRTQIEARGVRSAAVLDAMRRVPRERFVLAEEQARAYEDAALPAGDGQTISQPYIVAYMLEALALEPGQRVLEVGTGTGYQTALLATLGAEVYTIERIPGMLAPAEARLRALGLHDRVRMASGDGTLGWPEGGTFEGILVAAAAPRIPPALASALAPEGRLVIPVGDRERQHLLLATRGVHGLVTRPLIPCAFVPLVGEQAWKS